MFMHSDRLGKLLKSKRVSAGDMVILETGEEKTEGLVMPKHEFGNPDALVIKRKDGYNMGISVDEITGLRKISGKETAEKPLPKPIEIDKTKKNISILHTGGTIASRVDYKTGGVISSFSPEELVEMYPELKDIANIHSRLLSNLFSEDMRFEHYQKMAKAVAEEIKKGSDGVIITHGTDTLHYTSCALSFMLGNLPIPVILVGAQRSSDRGSSDAFLNLVSAARFIAETDFSGVALCMHENLDDNNCLILPGCRSRKLHSCRRDAFKAIDTNPIARIGDKIEFFSAYEKADNNSNLELKTEMEERVGIIKIHPNISPKVLEAYENYKGLVIEGTGLGHAPAEHGNEKFFDAVKKLSKKTTIVMTTQTIFGGVNMNVYSTGRKYMEIGVIPCSMTTEAAFIKMAWLLGNYPKAKPEEIRNHLLLNMHGEISERDEIIECDIGNK
jgi:glutamyl-tRNA(Gln) amidotransferase subunit D